MSRGCVREAAARRIEQIVAGHKLPFEGAADGELRAPEVVEQFQPVVNDGEPRAPSVRVEVGLAKQEIVNGRWVKTAQLHIIANCWAEDGEQGYRDAENLVEKIETDLIAKPWLANGRYRLIDPFISQVPTENTFPVYTASVHCLVEMPPAPELYGPQGEALDI
jgi:hypothetical protein